MSSSPYRSTIESPLFLAEVADYSVADHVFEKRPRALNCSLEGTLVCDFENATEISLHVVPGLNPYCPLRIRAIGSTAMIVLGMR